MQQEKLPLRLFKGPISRSALCQCKFVTTIHPQHSERKELLLPLYCWGNWGSERESIWPCNMKEDLSSNLGLYAKPEFFGLLYHNLVQLSLGQGGLSPEDRGPHLREWCQNQQWKLNFYFLRGTNMPWKEHGIGAHLPGSKSNYTRLLVVGGWLPWWSYWSVFAHGLQLRASSIKEPNGLFWRDKEHVLR
jgi:hypothetical protein